MRKATVFDKSFKWQGVVSHDWFRTGRWTARHTHATAVVLVSLAVYSIFICRGFLHLSGGQFEQYLQPGDQFAAPAKLEAHGFNAAKLRFISGVGWDGQFYYYLANDPFGLADTAQHMDMPRYRSQRVGVPLIANAVAQVTGQDWVSPELYLGVLVALLLFASFVAAMYVARMGGSPYWVLLWSLGGGPLFSVCFGFVDGAADAVLIIALIAFLQGRIWLYLVFSTLALLSRESYALFPAVLALAQLVENWFAKRRDGFLSRANAKRLAEIMSVQLVPVLVLLTWQRYLDIHLAESFPVMPGFLGLPLVAGFEHFLESALGNPDSTLDLPSVPIHIHQSLRVYSQAIGLGLFLALLVSGALVLLLALRSSGAATRSRNALPMVFAALSLIGLCACFGPTMVWEPVGYVKAASLVWMCYLLASLQFPVKPSAFLACVAAGLVVFGAESIYTHVSFERPDETPIQNVRWAAAEPHCIASPNARIEIESIRFAYLNNWFMRAFSNRPNMARVRVTNLSSVPLQPFPGRGTVNAGYQWFSADGTTLMLDGGRVPLPKTLQQNEQASISFPFELPKTHGNYRLRFTLVQEGCAWLYNLNPAIAADLPLAID